MSSRQNERSCHKISPRLFLTVGGEPMRFFLRPYMTKTQLQHIISAGGGMVCADKEPNAILLANPEDMPTVAGSAATLCVSTQYIWDSVQKNEQLDMEDYRVEPRPIQTRQRREGSGRMCYMPEEDTAILDFISNYKQATGGNKVWQEMEKQHVINRSWQSMKDRYRKYLCPKVPTEEGSEIQLDAQQNDTPQPSRTHNQQAALELLPGPEHSADSDVPAPESETAPETNITKMVSTEQLPQTASDTAALPHTSPQPHTDETQTEPPVESQGPPSSKAAPEEAGENADDDLVIHKETEPMGKKKTLQELGILAKASEEFEESEEETPDMVDASTASPTESAAEEDNQEHAPVTQINASNTDTVAQPQHQPMSQSDLQGKCPEAQGPSESCPPGKAGPGQREPVPSNSMDHMFFFDVPVLMIVSDSDSETQEMETSQPIRDEVALSPLQLEEVEEAGPGQREPVPSTSTAHTFLFDSESQEVETSQPIRDEVTFSQLQLEEVKRRIKGLMKKTNQDLESVTKALLKTSGDWSATLRYLMDGKGVEAFWDRHDDCLLLAGHTSELHCKYGEEGVAKRLAFLDAE